MSEKKHYTLAWVCALILLCPGCSTKYSVRALPSPIALQWPYAPARAKATYVQALYGFARSGGSGSIVRAVTGASERETGMFLLPVAVATGRDGRIAVADMGRRCVHLYIPSAKRAMRLQGSGKENMTSPVAVIFDDELRLYLSDSAGRIFVFGSDGSFLSSLRNAGNESLKRPTGLAYNPTQKILYVVDTLANRVYGFNPSGDVVLSFGGRGEETGHFNFPTHIVRSPAGALYVTDSLNFRIQIFDGSGGYLGSFGHHGDGSGDLAMPKGVAVDKDGILYVVDSLLDNVQLFNGDGQFLLTLGRRGSSFGEFWLPSGVFIDERNELYVCDTYNRRIQVFQLTEHY